uniref:SFRICE_041509 n=1 Tax=Spodoptera frugiperda TaxID=7108 RepID=A0A2H1VW91_SPOFR
MKLTCEITRVENPNEQQSGRKPARHDHLAWSEDPPFLRELYSLFPKAINTGCTPSGPAPFLVFICFSFFCTHLCSIRGQLRHKLFWSRTRKFSDMYSVSESSSPRVLYTDEKCSANISHIWLTSDEFTEPFVISLGYALDPPRLALA